MSELKNGLRLPESVDEISSAWLAAAMAASFPNYQLAGVTTNTVIPGTATKILMTLDLVAPDGTKVSQKVCVKGAFDPVIRAYDLGTIFACEAAFYRDVGSRMEITLPRCFYAEEDGVFGVLVLEDIAALGATFVDVTSSWPPPRAASLLEILATVHAFSWDWKPGVLPWLQGGSEALRNGIRGMAAEGKFEALISREVVARHLPRELFIRSNWVGGLDCLWSRDDGQVQCLGHGDAHLGQTYLERDGRPGLIDWQCAGLMPWAKDVAYFIGGALSVEDRRLHERDLLEHYLGALKKAGGPTIGIDEAWEEYRFQMLQGICWTMVTEQMQPIEAIAVMNERYLSAIADLDTLRLVLGSDQARSMTEGKTA